MTAYVYIVTICIRYIKAKMQLCVHGSFRSGVNNHHGTFVIGLWRQRYILKRHQFIIFLNICPGLKASNSRHENYEFIKYIFLQNLLFLTNDSFKSFLFTQNMIYLNIQLYKLDLFMTKCQFARAGQTNRHKNTAKWENFEKSPGTHLLPYFFFIFDHLNFFADRIIGITPKLTENLEPNTNCKP